MHSNMKKIILILAVLVTFCKGTFAVFFLHNDYSYLQEITFEMYTDEVPAYKVPEQLKSIEETLMFEVLHATWKDKHWVAYTLNKNLLGTFKVGQPALLDNGATKKIFFVAAFPGSVGGLDLYTSEYSNGSWSKPKNLGKAINTANNESNPGLLNDYTLTYSSGGIIKKLNLNTLKVVDLEETPVADKKVTEIVQNVPLPKAEKEKEIVTPVISSPTPAPQRTEIKSTVEASKPVVSETIVIQEPLKKEEVKTVPKVQQNMTSAPAVTPAASTPALQNVNVQQLGVQTRDAMLTKYKTAIQLGAFSTPKWEVFQPLSKYGQLITYKNEKGANVVWLVGFASRAAADAVLPQVKSVPGFEGAYVTGK